MKRPAETPSEGSERKRRSLFARLARDVKGSTLAIVGAALIPLTAMIGSGVDMSRAYMAKTRLQAACDAGALAGRRIMTADTLSQAVIDESRRFFNFNFPQGTYETAAFTPGVTKPSSGVVHMTASTTIPTVVMKIFGFDTLPLNVECDASLNFVNTDIVLVLDVTGSMDWDAAGNTTYVTADKRITALKEAVMALYVALAPVQAQLQANGLRLRYGIVPYSSTVNVGGLIRGVNSSYLADSATYQTRVFNYSTPDTILNPPEPAVVQIYGSSISQTNCDKYGKNQDFSGFNDSPTSGTGPAPIATWTRSFSNNEASGVDWGWSGSGDTSGTTRACRRRYVQTNTTYTGRFDFTSGTQSYEEEVVDTSQFKLGNPVTIATNTSGNVAVAGIKDPAELAAQAAGTGIGTATSTWNGCIMERDTVSTITSASGYTIPSGAYDLNINLIPTTDAQRWKPMWPAITYSRTAGSTSTTSGSSESDAACPAASRRLGVMTQAEMQTYVNGLTPVGSTYHDIGMIWGARMISTAGIFADACETYNGMPCTRHIIFMTDGQMDPDSATYQAYGIEKNDMRISGVSNADETTMRSRHTQRFKMACNAAEGLGTSIWVIAFGTTLSDDLKECASNDNQASTSTNKAALIAKFTEIGNNIGALRLTK